MTGQIGHRARLYITRQVRFNSDAFLKEKIDKCRILHRAHPMPDPRCTEQTDRVPHALRPRALSGMNGHLPTGVASAFEMFREKVWWKLRFVARQIERDDVSALRQ